MTRFKLILPWKTGVVDTASCQWEVDSTTRGVMLRHDRTEGWLEILGAVSSDP